MCIFEVWPAPGEPSKWCMCGFIFEVWPAPGARGRTDLKLHSKKSGQTAFKYPVLALAAEDGGSIELSIRRLG